jgi:DNA-directed RNA polymerase specialized sigma24 family protein
MSWGAALLARLRLTPHALGLAGERDARLDALMERFADGDESAFSDLAASLGSRLVPFFVRMGDGVDASEALTRETLLALEQQRAAFAGGASVVHLAYALAVRRHGVHDAAQRSTRRRVVAQGEAGRAGAVVACLRGLDLRRRAAFVLVRYERLSFAGSAEVLGVSEGRVRGWVGEALVAVESALGSNRAAPWVASASNVEAR